MIAIKEMTLPEKCAYCPCLHTDYQGWHCSTEVGMYKKICQDSLYFSQRPSWCPLLEVKDGET